MQKYFQIGIIIGVHGVSGEVKILPTTNNVDRFKKLKNIFLSNERVSSKAFNEKNLIVKKIISKRIHKSNVLMYLDGIKTFEEAKALKGKILVVDRKNAVKLKKDEFFIVDILGCSVFDEKRGALGIVEDIITTGSNDVYIVKDEKYGEILIPVLKDVVNDIDIINKRIEVKLLDGLIDD